MKKSLIAVIGVLIAVMGIAALLTYFTPSPNSEDNHLPSVQARNFSYALPDESGQKYLDNAKEDIQVLGAGQEIDFGIVTDPTDGAYVYFATHSFPEPPNGGDFTFNFMSIYRYNTSTYQFERIYKNSFKQGEFPGLHATATPIFHVLGYDDGKLVILAQDFDDSPGSCSEPLTLGRAVDDQTREMLSLNLASPYAKGLEAYEVPEDVYETALAKQQSCLDAR